MRTGPDYSQFDRADDGADGSGLRMLALIERHAPRLMRIGGGALPTTTEHPDKGDEADAVRWFGLTGCIQTAADRCHRSYDWARRIITGAGLRTASLLAKRAKGAEADKVFAIWLDRGKPRVADLAREFGVNYSTLYERTKRHNKGLARRSHGAEVAA